MTHDEARDVMPLYVVDADDDASRAELLAHLAGCEACRQALQEYQLAADALAQSVPQIRPRPELRVRTLAAIVGDKTPDQQRRVQSIARASAPPVRATWAPWLAVAAALVAAVTTAGLLQTRAELADLRVTHEIAGEPAECHRGGGRTQRPGIAGDAGHVSSPARRHDG